MAKKKRKKGTVVKIKGGKSPIFSNAKKYNRKRPIDSKVINKKKGKHKQKSTQFNPLKEDSIKFYFCPDANEKDVVQLPVPPSSFEVERPWNNQEIDIQGSGTYQMKGYRGLYKTQIESFFPEYYNPQYVQVGESKLKSPQWYDEKFAKWQNSRKVMRFITKGKNSAIGMKCLFNTYKSGFSQGGDINYSIEIVEYRTPKTKGGKVKRTSKKKAKGSKTYTTKTGDTLTKIARKHLGNAKYASKIYKKNKKAIDKNFKRQVKKMTRIKKHKFYSLSIYNRSLTKGLKLKIR